MAKEKIIMIIAIITLLYGCNNQEIEQKIPTDNISIEQQIKKIEEQLTEVQEEAFDFFIPIEKLPVFVKRNPRVRGQIFQIMGLNKNTGTLKKHFNVVGYEYYYKGNFQLYKNQVLFLNPERKIVSIDNKTGKKATINIPGFVSQFLVSNNKIFYKKGYCAEGGRCDIGEYDLITKKDKIIINDVRKKTEIPPTFGVLINYHDQEENTLHLRTGYADGIGVSRTEHKIRLNNLEVIKGKEIFYSSICSSLKELYPDCVDAKTLLEKNNDICNGVNIAKYESKNIDYIGCLK